MMQIRGYVDHIIYRNDDNAYTVLVLIPSEEVSEDGFDDPDGITCVGIFPSVTVGESLMINGDPVMHDSYGMQLKMRTYEEVAPEDTESLERYLGSGAVKGIGPVLAKRIIKKFGDDTFRILEVEPERLSEIRGISTNMAVKIAADLRLKSDQRAVMLELTRMNITGGMAKKIYDKYGRSAIDTIKKNPYRLADEIDGIGFRTADNIALTTGFRRDSEERAAAGIIYVLQRARGAGNTFMKRDDLIQESEELLGVSGDMIENLIFEFTMNRRIKVVGDDVYLYPLFRMEQRSAAMILSLMDRFAVNDDDIEEAVSEIEKEGSMTLDENQRKAVQQAAGNGVLILTGGPGTGKTTTIRSIIRYFMNSGLEVRLAAPTGRAAKRMSQAVGQEAQTIHRLLEVQKGGTTDDSDSGSDPGIFARNEENPIEGDVVIIDEMSMVDITLFYSLLRAIGEGTRLVLVGDVDQLPSVGPGNVLKDLIASEAFPVVRLTNIFRQKETGDIVLNAHRIRTGEKVDLMAESRDFFFSQDENADSITSKIVTMLKNGKLAGYVGAGAYDLQVLTPMRKGPVGVEALNRVLQDGINPPSPEKVEKKFGDMLFREGDKIMQTKNDYDITWQVKGRNGVVVDEGTGVFNGDLGRIREINNYSNSALVEFDDGHLVDYQFSGFENLTLAYAMTIHKSQGSEYPAVILPLLQGPEVLYNRNLLYTAVTRAKKCVVIIGSSDVFYRMESNDRQQYRASGLCERIREAQENEEIKR